MTARCLALATLSFAGAAAAAAQAPSAPPLTAKVTETLMGPSVMGGTMTRTYLSADGDHLAIIAAKGSRQVVLLDGVEGPAFDEIPATVLDPSRPAVRWSPTGGHSGYVGRRGGDYIAVIDGKEVGTAATQTSIGGTDPSGWRFWFSQDGAHVAYATIATGVATMMVDGVAGQHFLRIDFKQTIFNGNRLVYVGQSAEAVFRVVVDGKPSPVYADVRDLTLTPDGAHYAFLATLPGVAGPMRSVVVVDGVASPAYLGASDLEQAPDGRVAYVAVTRTTDQSGELVVGGTSTPNPTTFNISRPGGGSSRLGFDIRHVAFSPDGKGFAFVKRLYPNPGVQVIANGKPVGPTYQQVNQLQWSPDGTILFFLAGSPTGTFPVVNGTELDPVGSADEISFSPDGRHYAFQVYLGTPKIVVDGKDQPKAYGYVRESLRWSPDSKHIVYGAQTTVSSYQLVKDGVSQPGMLLNFMGVNRVQPALAFPPILFSPDGSRMAWVGMKDATSRQALAVDGVYYPAPTPNFQFPSFSPDSRHFAAVTTGNQGWGIMVDGKLSPSYEDLILTSTAAFRFLDAHTYRFYAIKAGQIYRITIDLP